jgi:DNA-binding CsgD family transcriptional regulator
VQPPESRLTEIEQQILALVLQRKRNREIAGSLFVSLRTVESHLTRIFRKLGVSTKSQLFRQLSTAPAQEEIRIISRNSAETARNRR